MKTQLAKEIKPIFIHSLFRTGSTYIWNKFRENPSYYCYYEPFHQILAGVNLKNIETALTKNYEQVKHPHLTRYYLYEYNSLLETGREGVPYFKKSFSFDEFCSNDFNPDLKKYIDHLVVNAGDKVPVFQFNRSALRIKWFRQNYPNCLNIYLARHPRDQWESYMQLFKRTEYIGFFLMDLIIASMNKQKDDFLMLANHLPLIRYNNDRQVKENHFYHIILKSYTEEEKYFIFYYTWFRSLITNVLHANFILNINLLSKKSSYKEKIRRNLSQWGIEDIDFKDALITEYSLHPLPPETMNIIEENTRKLVIQSMSDAQINDFFEKISQEDREYFQLMRGEFEEIRKEKVKLNLNILEKTIEKFESIILLLAEDGFNQVEEKQNLLNQVKQRNLKLSVKDEQLELKDNYLKEKDQVIANKDEALQKKDLLLLEKDKLLEQKDMIIAEKDQVIVNKDEELQKKDLLMLEKDEQLKQKDMIIAEKDQIIVCKDDELQQKALLLLEKYEQLKQKDIIIAEKERLILKEDGELGKKVLLLSRKNERLKQRLEIIAEKDIRLTEMREQLNQKDMFIKQQEQIITNKDNQLKKNFVNLQKIKEQILQTEEQLKKVRSSYTYRTGKALVTPLKLVKALITLNSKSAKSPGIFHRKEKHTSITQEQYEKKINLVDQLHLNFGRHRSGWSYAIRQLRSLHNPQGVLLDTFIERTFCWSPDGIKPHLQPWIGFIHVPPNIPEWFHAEQSNDRIFKTEAWRKSIPYCQGLFTLSAYHKKSLEKKHDFPINNLLFPTEIPKLKWSWDRFAANKDKKIVQVGWWLRKLHAIFQLPIPKSQYKKIFLNVEHKNIPLLLTKERNIFLNEGTFRDEMYETAETITYLPDNAYDKLLGENIVFVSLYDASANNTVIECIARNTPILINPIEAVKEYLLDDYPLYYNSLEEAAEKVVNQDLIYQAHQYLINLPIKNRLTGSYFFESFVNSQIYQGLKVNYFQ